MSLYEIIGLLKEYIKLGIFIIILLSIGYFIYKKVLKGKRRVNIKKALFYILCILYLVILIGAVFLDRGKGMHSINLHLFNSYIEAYHMMKISLFRNIILNILLFIPLGFILPIYFKKLDKWYKTIAFGILTTIMIELVQYTTRIGIFELDDILNNNIGILIGYSYYKIYNVFKNKGNKKKILVYILPTIITMLPFITIYIIYQNQELGNLDFMYNYKVNTKNIDIKSNVEFRDKTGEFNIYRKNKLTKEEARNLASNIFNNLNSEISLDRIIEYYEETAFYYSKDGKYSLTIEYNDGSYKLVYHDNIKNGGLENKIDEETAIKYLNELNIYLPNNYSFNYEDSEIIADMIQEGNDLYNGSIKFEYSNNFITRISNNLIKYEKVKEKEIISEKDAYEKLLNGEFKCYDNIKKILVNEVKLIYVIDSKGYYVPVYEFETNADQFNLPIRINAVKNN